MSRTEELEAAICKALDELENWQDEYGHIPALDDIATGLEASLETDYTLIASITYHLCEPKP